MVWLSKKIMNLIRKKSIKIYAHESLQMHLFSMLSMSLMSNVSWLSATPSVWSNAWVPFPMPLKLSCSLCCCWLVDGTGLKCCLTGFLTGLPNLSFTDDFRTFWRLCTCTLRLRLRSWLLNKLWSRLLASLWPWPRPWLWFWLWLLRR